ncbi:phage baseplate assembly protein V [Humidesulfovibrio mexicanus]|uniref:Phage baseplate assembly protein V n=1 Tax=Humidesulfovibrio mexicanus TaxID=147047 RepID=A0A239BBU1_9BACT|nr:phage baseplate assembly protein V [Humidesulfovibrio mexicanus]SNS05475.1 phage baseplate assembly protein V [Humidesulfovibrio mexicanus]
MMRALQKMHEGLRRKMATLVNRAIVQMVADADGLQELQVQALADEVMGRIERMQQYGFTSVPLPGAEAVLLSAAGCRSNAIVVAVDDRRYRLTGLQGGEVALYTDEGDSVVLKRGHLIEVSTETLHVKATTRVLFETPSFAMIAPGGGATSASIQGSLHATGNIATDADALAGSVSLRGHVHPENDGGGPTGSPVGG